MRDQDFQSLPIGVSQANEIAESVLHYGFTVKFLAPLFAEKEFQINRVRKMTPSEFFFLI